jgi:hypothetical protein
VRTFHFFSLALGAALSLVQAQPADPAGVNHTILSQIPERIKHFIDDQTVPGAVTA